MDTRRLSTRVGRSRRGGITMEFMWQQILGWFIPFLLGSIITFLINRVKKDKKKDKAIETGVQALLRNEIIRNSN